MQTPSPTRRDMHGMCSRVERRRSRGFTLIVVVWLLALILLLSTAVAVGVRYRTRVDTTLLDVRRAELAAESAINFAILLRLAKYEAPSFPLECRMPDGEQVAITVTEEAGKVDLNAASPQTLARLFVALIGNPAQGERIAAAILSRRSGAGASPSPGSAQSKPIPFQSILELEGVSGITPELFRAALPLVTVGTGRIEPDPAAASDALRQMLGLRTNATNTTAPAQNTGDITIRADVSAGGHVRFIREALVSLRSANGQSFRIREWRHADADDRLRDSDPGNLGPCFPVRQSEQR
jgi:general secretion pathway protein K